MRINDDVLKNINSLEELVNIIGRTKDGRIISDVGEYNTFKNRFESFKEMLKQNFPDFTEEEILKFTEHSYRLNKIYEWYGAEQLLKALEYESKKK